MERTLYNAVLSGVSLACDTYFYDNPLESDGSNRRKPWFDCACCPPNIARLILSIGKYCVGSSDTGIFVALPVGGQYKTSNARIRIMSNFPWSGDYEIRIEESSGLDSISLRVPDWTWGIEVMVNDKVVEVAPKDRVLILTRDWARGDTITVSCKMPAQWLTAHPRVLDCAGKVALRRGPLIYCVEESDLGMIPQLWAADTDGTIGVRNDLTQPRLCTTLEVPGFIGSATSTKLYTSELSPMDTPKTARFVPYFSWANHQPGAMQVWIKRGR